MHGKIPLSIRVYSSSELVRDRKQESEQFLPKVCIKITSMEASSAMRITMGFSHKMGRKK